MKPKKILEELKQSLEPYLFFWDEWTANDNCNLTSEEVAVINSYLETEFEIGLFESFLFYNKIKDTEALIRKLNLGYQVFKDVVIVNFLSSIIHMARDYGYNAFLETPVRQLNVSDKLKANLMSFKAYTLQQLFIIYKADDFSRGWVYKRIVEFQTIRKQEELILHS
jgi:hypothetical protein